MVSPVSVEPEQKLSLIRNLIEAGVLQGDEAVVQFEGVGIYQPEGRTDVLRTAFCPVTKTLILSETHCIGIYSSPASESVDPDALYDPKSCDLLRSLKGSCGFALVETHVRWRGSTIYMAHTTIKKFQSFRGQVNRAESYLESGVILVN